MIRGFIESWSLFATSYICGWLVAALLALLGVFVVARDQIFLGAALSQASTAGIAFALWLSALVGSGWSEHQGEGLELAMAVLSSVLAAWLAGRVSGSGRESHEAVTGWIFLLGASLFVILLSNSPLGPDALKSLLFTSLLGATRVDAWTSAGLVAVSVLVVALFRAPLLLSTLDPSMARAIGVPVRFWSAAGCLWLGLAVGLSLRASGLLYTFGCLVLPALVAKRWVRELRTLLVAAPIVALAAAAPAFLLAHHYNLPLEPTAVALLCGLAGLCWLVEWHGVHRRNCT